MKGHENKTVLHLRKGSIHIILTKRRANVELRAHQDIESPRDLLRPHETRPCDIRGILERLDRDFKNMRFGREFYEGV